MFSYSQLSLEIVGEEFVTSIHHYNEFYVNLLFDRSIYRPMCTHMGKPLGPICFLLNIDFSQN